MHDPERVLDFWFGDVDAAGFASDAATKRWWDKSPAFDAEVCAHFAADHAAIMAGEREGWLDTPRGRLAYVVVLDQLSRNMFRDTPQMFAGDRRALRTARDGCERGHDDALRAGECVMLYMPFMHSEALADQDVGVAKYEALAARVSGAARAGVEKNLRFMIRHRDIIARWGRFPHRNAILGRTSTHAEVAFLQEPGSSF